MVSPSNRNSVEKESMRPLRPPIHRQVTDTDRHELILKDDPTWGAPSVSGCLVVGSNKALVLLQPDLWLTFSFIPSPSCIEAKRA